MLDIKKQCWEDSYKRGENYMFYPKEETVNFINRFIRKKTGSDSYGDFMIGGGGIKALDFGCGIGRITALMCEFGIDAYGIDISENAISQAKGLLSLAGFDPTKVSTYDGQHIPFSDCFFDFTISEGVLDSLPFSLAKQLLLEIDRVSTKYFYLSLMSSSSIALFDLSPHQNRQNFDGEIVVEEKHEFGTVQSFYNLEKIHKLIEGTSFKIIWGELIEHNDILKQNTYGRYHLVLEKNIER